MAGKPLNVQDATFLAVETADYPTHIAGLQIFEMPERDPEFVGRLVDRLMKVEPTPFWRRTIAPTLLSQTVRPEWVEAEHVDLSFHVHRVALPEPGSVAQLERLVERLHARRLDRRRPLWEIYYIEGLGQNRFAVYSKVHHALVDGMGGVWLALMALATDPKAEAIAPWSVDMPDRPRAEAPTLSERLDTASRVVTDLSLQNLRQTVDWAARLSGSHERADLPFAAPVTRFNGRVDGQRRFATRSLSIKRLKAVAKATESTLNDVVLAITGSALRTWMLEQDELPARSLVATCPVSVRSADGAGNNLSALLADLATDIDGPLARLARVSESTQRGKRMIAQMSRDAAQGWALAMGVLGLAPAMVNGGKTLPPLANLVISNVPGPREARYLGGARMVGYYPVSILTHGQGLNITLVSRDKAVDFGLTGSRGLVENLGRLGDALEASLEALEAAVIADFERREQALDAGSTTLEEVVRVA